MEFLQFIAYAVEQAQEQATGVPQVMCIEIDAGMQMEVLFEDDVVYNSLKRYWGNNAAQNWMRLWDIIGQISVFSAEDVYDTYVNYKNHRVVRLNDNDDEFEVMYNEDDWVAILHPDELLAAYGNDIRIAEILQGRCAASREQVRRRCLDNLRAFNRRHGIDDDMSDDMNVACPRCDARLR